MLVDVSGSATEYYARNLGFRDIVNCIYDYIHNKNEMYQHCNLSTYIGTRIKKRQDEKIFDKITLMGCCSSIIGKYMNTLLNYMNLKSICILIMSSKLVNI